MWTRHMDNWQCHKSTTNICLLFFVCLFICKIMVECTWRIAIQFWSINKYILINTRVKYQCIFNVVINICCRVELWRQQPKTFRLPDALLCAFTWRYLHAIILWSSTNWIVIYLFNEWYHIKSHLLSIKYFCHQYDVSWTNINENYYEF